MFRGGRGSLVGVVGGAGAVLSALVPPTCPVCGTAGAAPCRRCWAGLRPAGVGPVPAGLDACRSLLAYEDQGRELLARLKYRNARSSVAWLVAGMAALVSAAWATPDLVTWAPTTAARRRSRGFDQAELLARGVAVEVGVPCRRVLERATGPPQTGRSSEERSQGPRFGVRGGRAAGAVAGRSVLLVDDVVTTGATLSAAARALRSAGACSVVAVTAGRTPRRRHDPP